ncbi:hypothetical protein IAQ61_006035 [Plenodomus lingam]|uniref:uncharacterized protein n=1 Tax=Leptosphaeria maculans TaxID=5022 RepID=UPI00331685EE|nr:hypothetical protein IAQ61_006035 [Plenodomus lingam]
MSFPRLADLPQGHLHTPQSAIAVPITCESALFGSVQADTVERVLRAIDLHLLHSTQTRRPSSVKDVVGMLKLRRHGLTTPRKADQSHPNVLSSSMAGDRQSVAIGGTSRHKSSPDETSMAAGCVDQNPDGS